MQRKLQKAVHISRDEFNLGYRCTADSQVKASIPRTCEADSPLLTGVISLTPGGQTDRQTATCGCTSVLPPGSLSITSTCYTLKLQSLAVLMPIYCLTQSSLEFSQDLRSLSLFPLFFPTSQPWPLAMFSPHLSLSALDSSICLWPPSPAHVPSFSTAPSWTQFWDRNPYSPSMSWIQHLPASSSQVLGLQTHAAMLRIYNASDVILQEES